MKREYMFNTEKAGSEKVLALYLALDMILRFRSLYLRKKKKKCSWLFRRQLDGVTLNALNEYRSLTVKSIIKEFYRFGLN